MKALQDSTLNFTIDDIRRSMRYDIIVRYEPIQLGTWEDVQIIIERDGPVDPNGPCANSKPEYDRLWVQLPYHSRNSVAQPTVCLEKGKQYNVILQFRKFNSHMDTPTASILIDSVSMILRIHKINVQIYVCRQLEQIFFFLQDHC